MGKNSFTVPLPRLRETAEHHWHGRLAYRLIEHGQWRALKRECKKELKSLLLLLFKHVTPEMVFGDDADAMSFYQEAWPPTNLMKIRICAEISCTNGVLENWFTETILTALDLLKEANYGNGKSISPSISALSLFTITQTISTRVRAFQVN